MKRVFFIILPLIILTNCKKRQTPISWTANYTIPISSDTINLADILSVDKFKLSDDGLHSIYKDTIQLYSLEQNDFLPAIDFNFTDTIEIPSLAFGIPFLPGVQIPYTFSQNETFNFEDIQLTEIVFNELKINYTIHSNIDGAIDFNLTIPSATNSQGQTLSKVLNIPNSNGQMSDFHGEINLNNITFDLTDNGSSFNNINTSFTFGASSSNAPDIITLDNNDFLSIDIEITNLSINTIKGYLGSIEINDSTSINLPFMDKFKADSIQIEDPIIDLIIKNGLGLDAQVTIKELELANNNTSYNLTHPIVNHPLNISRALDLGYDFQYAESQININNQNSNIEQLINVLPNKINIDYAIITNPLGNHSGYNDFYKTIHPLSLDLLLDLPLKIFLDKLSFADTLSVEIPKEIAINSAILHIEILNEFPVECCISIQIPNGNTIAVNPNCIDHSLVDNNGNTINGMTSIIQIDLDPSTITQLTDKGQIILNFEFNTPQTNNTTSILSTHSISYKMGIDLNTSIEIE